jgi:hypothetical protein
MFLSTTVVCLLSTTNNWLKSLSKFNSIFNMSSWQWRVLLLSQNNQSYWTHRQINSHMCSQLINAVICGSTLILCYRLSTETVTLCRFAIVKVRTFVNIVKPAINFS